METDKYKHMAYYNETGKKWLSTIVRPDIWSIWQSKADNIAPPNAPENYAHRILIEAIWFIGYVENTSNRSYMNHCADRLRKPPDMGDGVKKRGTPNDLWHLVYRCPIEFIELDNFLEQYVRPLI